jgi:glycosyltransferase involved in cell wall biosynthesis
MPGTLIICPVYNEHRFLRSFLNRLLACYDKDVLFVDDGSTDGSADLIRRSTHGLPGRPEILSHERRRGYGAALATGFRYALRNGYGGVVTLDADLQHRPEDIGRFLQELESAEAVLGTRYGYEKVTNHVPRTRYLINRYVAGMLKRCCSVRFSDPFCGFRAYRASVLRRFRLSEKSYGVCLEILLEIVRLQATFRELSIESIYLDSARTFLDGLDNPLTRLDYYRRVIREKLNPVCEEGVCAR